MTLRCELECLAGTNVGLAAGRYSGTNRPDLKRTPHALHNVFGPIGPLRHCGVLSDPQCKHLRTELSKPSVRLDDVVFVWLFSDDFTRRRRDDQSQGAARERLLRTLPGTKTSV